MMHLERAFYRFTMSQRLAAVARHMAPVSVRTKYTAAEHTAWAIHQVEPVRARQGMAVGMWKNK